jgi:hypothetical protein
MVTAETQRAQSRAYDCSYLCESRARGAKERRSALRSESPVAAPYFCTVIGAE